MLTNFNRIIRFAVLLLFISTGIANGQISIRPYTLAFSENLKGGTVMFGNTMMHVLNADSTVDLDMMNKTANPANGVGGVGFSLYGNDDVYMSFVDIDGSTGTGAGTKNSSSADLVLPAGTNNIRFARLYWGGRISSSVVAAAPDTLRKIKIRKGVSAAYTAAITPAANVDFIDDLTDITYQAYVDITQFINTSGTGTYTVADIPATDGFTITGGQYAGWAIVVAYENPAQPFNSVRVYDGYAQVFNSGFATTLDVTLSGLNVPDNPLLSNDAVMTTMAWEGDANLYDSPISPQGDFIKINDVAISNTVNPVTNFWNGSISKNGVNITTKNPNYSNQLGIDIDEVNVGTGFNIAPNATSVLVQFGTEADQYYPSVFTFNIRMKDPLVTLNKIVTDANGSGFVDANEELTYTLSGSNIGDGTAYNTVITDTLPSNVTYVVNTLEVINGAGVPAGIKTDAADADQALLGNSNGKAYVKFFLGAGATGTTGGQLPVAPNGNYSVRFKVKAGAIPGNITNTARITANSQAGDVFTDDATAIIGPDGGPVAVKLISFEVTRADKTGILQWATESELNSDYFIVERSIDGIHFEEKTRLKGNGTSSFRHAYQYNDELDGNAEIYYYRLKIVDLDGQYGFSKIIALKVNDSMNPNDFNVFPNPFVSDIKVSVSSLLDEPANFRIISIEGKEILNRKIVLQKGINIVVLKGLQAILPGNYILEVTGPGKRKLVSKIVKNN